jgi:uncharacterized protein
MLEPLNDEHSFLVMKTQDIVRERLKDQQAGHGMDHIMRVLHMARQIHGEVAQGDRLVIDLAALLHDVGDAKFHDGEERSAEFSREILRSLNSPIDIVEHVAQIVDNISFRKGVDASLLSIEGKIVQDADRLDALGAIGIVRTIEYGAMVGQPFHATKQDRTDSKTGIEHFHEKLFKVRDLLNTEPARRIADSRDQFMKDFVRQYLAECRQTEND